ncbi:MAG: saccharopine dehydrogenase NADP-binding domain-containing protein [Woeseiaceae bacterium]|nr:saccharopine dehydrogenase NADP-binding domain-containing protein [Woeseiaceae bacterium]
MSKRVLLVGATGYAGRSLAGYLLEHTDATIILAARNRTRLHEILSAPILRDGGDRIETLELDATDFDPAAVGDFDLLANATGDGPHNAPLIEACLDRGADWIDMQMTNELLDPPSELRARVESAGSCFVIQAGFHPGMVAPLVRYADQQMNTMDRAIVGSVLRDEGGMPFTSGFSELVESFRDYTGEAYEDGEWQKLKATEYPRIVFEHGFGELVTYPMELPELRRLVDSMPDLKATGFSVAGFNWFGDYVVTPLIIIGSRIAPRSKLVPLGKLLSWSTRTFAKPPYGTIVQVDAEGRRGDRPAHFRLALFHDDAYAMTTAPTMAMIRQMLKGSVEPGIHLMGLCCDPIELLDDIERTDVAVTWSTDDTGQAAPR